MCGFAGIINYKKPQSVSSEELRAMGEAILHRGPDDYGDYLGDNYGYCFRRLSIIDLEAGHQPMVDTSGRWVIVFNGEVYNFQEIRKKLQGLGVRFNTLSDTEVILEAYKAYGTDALNMFEGMFAFCITDTQTGEFIIARDHFGIKPMFIMHTDEGIVFGSELKSIYATGRDRGGVNATALDSYFSYSYIIAPLSIYRNIEKLRAGHYLKGNLLRGELSEQIRYWQPILRPDYSLTFDEHKERLRAALKKSVQNHLIADVPVGSFLSGGIDSSSVVGLLEEEQRKDLKTFTVGFELAGFDEAGVARNTSKWLGTDHHEIRISGDTKISIEQFVKIYDEPFGDSSAIPAYFISEYAAKHVKVALSGDGGDELFGGYTTYQRLQKMYDIPMPFFVRRVLFGMANKILPEDYPGKRFAYTMAKRKEDFYPFSMIFPQYEKGRFFQESILKEVMKYPAYQLKAEKVRQSEAVSFLERIMESDIQTLLVDDMLTKVDRASMAASLEVRVPLISRTIFEQSMNIPLEYKIKDGMGKFILREAARPFITDEVFSGKKRGFTIPIHKWFKSNFHEFVGDHLSSKLLREYIQPAYLDNLLGKKNLNSLSTRIWPLVMFSSWLHEIHDQQRSQKG